MLKGVKKDIISLIVQYLKTLNLQFTILSKEQIKLITLKNSNIMKIVNKINLTIKNGRFIGKKHKIKLAYIDLSNIY